MAEGRVALIIQQGHQLAIQRLGAAFQIGVGPPLLSVSCMPRSTRGSAEMFNR